MLELRNSSTPPIKLNEFIKGSHLNFTHVNAKALCEPIWQMIHIHSTALFGIGNKSVNLFLSWCVLL
jgi:hypothetical protein